MQDCRIESLEKEIAKKIKFDYEIPKSQTITLDFLQIASSSRIHNKTIVYKGIFTGLSFTEEVKAIRAIADKIYKNNFYATDSYILIVRSDCKNHSLILEASNLMCEVEDFSELTPSSSNGTPAATMTAAIILVVVELLLL